MPRNMIIDWLLEPRTVRYEIYTKFKALNFWVFFGDLMLMLIGLMGYLYRSDSTAVDGKGKSWHWGALIGAYLFIRVGQVFYKSNQHSCRARRKEDKVRELLNKAHRHLFGDFAGIRYTLFQPDEINPHWLVPVARFEFGHEHSRAAESKARYRRGMGHTGMAWERFPTPGGLDAFFERFNYLSRKAMIADFRALSVPKRIANAVSGYMEAVGGIYSVRLTSRGGLDDLGVLSIDLRSDVIQSLDAHNKRPTPEDIKGALPDLTAYLSIMREIKEGGKSWS